MKGLGSLKKELLHLKNEIKNDLSNFQIDTEKISDVNNWYSPSEKIFLYEQGGKLCLSANDVERQYISFLEKNASFGILPRHELKILPDERFTIDVKGELLGAVHSEMYIIEYSDSSRVQTHIVKIGEKTTIKTHPEAKTIRIAVKITGSGVATIEGIDFKSRASSSFSAPSNRVRSAPKNVTDIKMACIFDEFTTTCYQEEVELITFTPDNWETVLTENIPDVLMVESAWQGNNGAWQYKIGKYNNADQSSLFDVLEWCQSNDVPTVFWNKEDPIHFHKFVDTAKLFDYIFTTDALMIPKYQEAAGHENVFALPFSAQPKLHNPIKNTEERINKISFAGSYYANRHKERREDMENMLDIAAEFGLDIFDRNYANPNKHFRFPERFAENIKGSLKYDEIDKSYKGYKVMLNINSVKNSPTMFSRRVFEGLASGTPVISSYSRGVKKIFKDIPLISENQQELREDIQRLMTDEKFYQEKSLVGLREVYLYHTYKHRLQYIFDKMGHQLSITVPEVTVIAKADSKAEFEQILETFNAQSWKHKKLLVLLENFDGYIDILNDYNTDRIQTYVASYMDHYDRISELVQTEYMAFFNMRDYYGENYLMDMMIATDYSEADIIGKRTTFTVDGDVLVEQDAGKEYEFVYDLNLCSSLLKVHVFKGYPLSDVLEMVDNDGPLNALFRKGHQMFSTNKYNYVKNGRESIKASTEKIEL
ncbi:hypothetical protein EQV77_09020 [Halobacillus fulvus]|nr:hypothetical protein EQV77_09020 [Halobacillus fulvus]